MHVQSFEKHGITKKLTIISRLFLDITAQWIIMSVACKLKGYH